MVGKIQTKNVYVDTEYDNIIIVDPNLLRGEDGSPVQRLVDHEDLVYYANLETKIVPRTKLAVGESLDIINTTVASFIGGDEDRNLNFLKPKNKNRSFDSSWSDQITGDLSRAGGGTNQTVEQVSTVTNSNGTKRSVFNRNITNYKDTQTLGIKSINLTITSAGVPQVDMTLVDVQGRTLFEQGDNSLYSVFFNLPYPAFFLTLKGYYGKAVRYQLALISFNAKIDQKNGNFDITLKLIGRTNALLFDTIMGYAKTAPKMYKRDYYIGGNQTSSNQTGVSTATEKKISTTLGRQKLEEVYSEYEAKGLIPEGFPRLSMEDFQYRIGQFEKWLSQQKDEVNTQLLQDIYRFRKDLQDLKKEVYDYSISKYLDLNSPFYIDNQIYYPFKNTIKRTDKDGYKSRIKAIIEDYTKDLKKNKTFGDNGYYQIGKNATKVQSSITVNIKPERLIKEKDLANGDLPEKVYQDTFFIRTGKTFDQDPDAYLKFKANLVSTLVTLTKELDPTGKITNVKTDFFVFGINKENSTVKGEFLSEIDNALKDLSNYEQDIEKGISEGLATVLATSDKGIGFRPTIRNVFAVLFAGCDTFYRLMENTHTLAWNQRSNPSRIKAILKDSQGVDSKGFVSGNNEENTNIVYPWPQYYVNETDAKGKERFTIQYPGDPQYTNLTNGNIKSVWPEVDFTEQYLYGATLKLDEQDNSIYNNNENNTSYVQLNGIWKNNTQPYINTAESSILFEILERSYVNANYGKFNRTGGDKYQIDKLIADLEGENIKTAISNNLFLIEIIKNLNFKYSSFKNYLENTFLTRWFYYKNSLFSTEEIQRQETSFDVSSLYSTNYLNSQTVKTTSNLETKMKEFLKDTSSNEQVFLDTYPLTELSWLQENMADGIAINSTNIFNQTINIFTIQPSLKKISRLNKNQNDQNINLFTNSAIFENKEVFLSVNNSSNQEVSVTSAETLKQFYEQRLNDPNKFVFTESVIDYGNEYSGEVKTKIQTTSLLNTPYFVNALIEGVEIEKNSGDTPYAALGYLYLNSLPLITTREKLKTLNGTSQSDLEYLAASLTKYSGLHQLPYAWVLKYGSIWYRYKKWVETGNDILEDNTIWKNFDAANAWDPTGNTKTKTYKYDFDLTGGSKNITLQTEILGPTLLSIPSNTQSFSVGFYPKVVNSLYRFFTTKDLFSAYTDSEISRAYTEKGLKIINNTNSGFNVDANINNAYEQTIVNNFYVSITIENNSEFKKEFNNKVLMFPSMGVVPFNQATLECFDNQNNKKIPLLNNDAFYNGSVRSLWGCSNFGYFDHNKIKKPKPTEYIKKIKTTNDIQNSFDLLSKDSVNEYSSIEEIFAIFSKETLDLFEERFLYFIDPKSSTEGNILDFENWQADQSTPAKPVNVELKRLFYQIKNLFVLDKSSYTNEKSSQLQMQNFNSGVKEFLNYDVILEIKNPGSFNRKVFNEFSDSVLFKPTDIIYTYKPYNGVLPPQITTLLSKSNYPNEWEALQEYVGFSTIQNLDYNGTTSFITDFFKEMDIEFTVDNIIRLQQIIKIYVSKRLKDNSLNKSKFKQELTDYLTKQERYQAGMINETFSYLNNILKNVKRIDEQIQSPINGNVVKLETYSTLKAFNDKWTAGSDLLSKTIFEDFLFLDRTNSDIGDEFTIDITSKKFRGLIKDNDSKPIMDIISTILDDNNFIFFAMPSYVNFYNIQKSVNEGTDIPYEIPNSLFGTHLSVDYINSKPKFLCMYIGEPSKHPDSNNENNRFNNDSFDLRKSSNPLRVPSSEKINKNNSNLITAFNVDFGIQNQNIFSDIQIDMSEKKNTAESFRLEAELANSASADKIAQQSTSLYNIYRARSYTCGVTSMGNAMIQPTMYFNLRHVPLFYGPYFIMEVKHKIDEKSFMTDFKGYRVSKYSLPDPDSYLVSINKNFLEKLKSDEIKKQIEGWTLSTGYTSDPNATINNSPTLNSFGVCEDKVVADYKDTPFVNSVSKTITDDELIKLLKEKSSATDLLRAYLFGIANVSIGNRVDNDQIFTFNFNLFAYQTSSQYGGNLSDYIKQQTCITINNVSTPIIAFGDYGTAIDMGISKEASRMTLVKDLINLNNQPTLPIAENIGKAFAQIYIALFESNIGFNSSGNPDFNLIYEKINKKLQSGDLKQSAFDAYIRIFANAATKFNATIN